MSDDNYGNLSYSQYMSEGKAYLTITLDLNDPVEIGDFAALFSGIGGQFDAYLKENHPDLRGRAQMYVKEVRHGSIVADLIPNIPDLIGVMDGVLIVTGFGTLFSKRLRRLVGGAFIPDASKADIRDIGKTVQSVSKDTGGQMRIESVRYENGLWRKSLQISFDTKEARRAEETLERQAKQLEAVSGADKERVLMTFERSRKSDTNLDKTGELVVIEEIDDRPKALIYGSQMIEQEIKHEVREADDNIYKKGFVVDVNVRRRSGRIIGYAVTKVHQVIDLGDG